MKNVKLMAAIFKRGIRQKELAEKTGIPRSYISQAVNGHRNLSEDQKGKIAEAVQESVADLF